MALFGGSKESKEEKKARKEQEILERYGLQELNDAANIESVKRIATELAGENWFDVGMALSGASEKQLMERQMYYQRAIVEQNFIMIRQLDKIAKLLEK